MYIMYMNLARSLAIRPVYKKILLLNTSNKQIDNEIKKIHL